MDIADIINSTSNMKIGKNRKKIFGGVVKVFTFGMIKITNPILQINLIAKGIKPHLMEEMINVLRVMPNVVMCLLSLPMLMGTETTSIKDILLERQKSLTCV